MATLGGSPYPELPQALAQWRNFLAQQSLPTTVKWIRPATAVYLGTQWYILDEVRTNSENDIAAAYQTARQQPYGILFKTICASRQEAFCYLGYPKNAEDAEYRLITPGSLKFSIPQTVLPASYARGRLAIYFLKLREKNKELCALEALSL